MKIEYMLIKQKDDFYNTVEQLKNLLHTNSRIELNDDSLMVSGVELSYSLTVKEINTGNKAEMVFCFDVSVREENDNIAIKLEEFDVLLRRINSECGNHFKINTIWDDISIYYAEKLYPHLVKVENLLRKIIYRFMINIAGSSWFDNTVPQKVKDSIGETLKKNNLSLDETGEDQLYYADFIQLGLFFFQPYTLKPLTQESIKKIKENLGGNEEELNALLENYTSKSNWDRYFAEKIPVDDLLKKWRQLYIYRNQVAHTKRVKRTEYEKAMEIINELVIAFDSCLEHIDDVEMSEDESTAAQEVAKETVSSGRTVIRGGMDDRVLFSMPSKITIGDEYPGVVKAAEILGDANKYFVPATSILSGLSSGLLQFEDNTQRLMSSIYGESKLASALAKNDTIVSAIGLAAAAQSNLYEIGDPIHLDTDSFGRITATGSGSIKAANIVASSGELEDS